jgi:hypothetical protein
MTATVSLLTIPDNPNVLFTTILDSVAYDLLMHWNSRDESWYLTLGKQNLDPLFKVKVTTMTDLLKTHRALDACPKGALIAIDTMKGYGRITRNGWSSGRWKLYYASEDYYQQIISSNNSSDDLSITIDAEFDPRFTKSTTRL